MIDGGMVEMSQCTLHMYHTAIQLGWTCLLFGLGLSATMMTGVLAMVFFFLAGLKYELMCDHEFSLSLIPAAHHLARSHPPSGDQREVYCNCIANTPSIDYG